MATQSIYQESEVKRLEEQVKNKENINLYKSDATHFAQDKVCKLIGVIKPEGLCDELCKLINNDFKAAVTLYEAYPNLTPLQATDKRFWVYLAHTELYKYVRNRYQVEKIVLRRRSDGSEPDRTDSERGFILDHWFGQDIRQALSGLWWSVKLSIDETRTNPYELTEYLFKHYDFRTRRLTSSIFGRNKEGTLGLLEGMKSLKTYETNFEARSNFAIMYFNNLGGTRQLTALDRDFFIEELQRIDPEVQKYFTREDIDRNKDHLFDDL